MIQISTKDFDGYVAKNEIASTPYKNGTIKLEMQTNPIEGTIRYVLIVRANSDERNVSVSRPIKKFRFAMDVFNNAADNIDEDGGLVKINSDIAFSNNFA